ncbi:GntR family transcriptional regulator [Streptomyces sp. NPDC127098]|uniref:GntR family transcriptional regulator n=1 Tax=Streptomyces sp. NPDC127098 TaxID=3347137 RepID=UPI0036657432
MSRYQKIANHLRLQIQSGKYRAGDRLPTETALSKRYSVGLPTLRQAIGVLQAEGLIDRQHGRGTFVRAPQPRVTYSNADLVPDRWTVGSIETDVATYETDAQGEVARLMAVPEGTPIVECVYVIRRRGSTPHSIVRGYVPRDLATADSPVTASGPWPWAYDLRSRLATAGIQLDRTVERVTARPPTAGEAETLGISIGVSVLVIERTSTDTTGRVVEVAFMTLSGDRTEAVYMMREAQGAP